MTSPATIINGMSIAKKGYRGVSVPACLEDTYQLEAASLAGCLTLIRLKANDPAISPLMHSPKFKNCVEAIYNHGKIVFQELLPDSDDEDNDMEDPAWKETYKHHLFEYSKELCNIGDIAYGSKFMRDYWPTDTLLKENQIVMRAEEIAESYSISIENEWSASLRLDDFHQIERCANKMAFDQWDTPDAPFILYSKLYTNVCIRLYEYRKLSTANKQDPSNETVLNLIYAATFHKQGFIDLLHAQPRRPRLADAFFEKNRNTTMAITDTYRYHIDKWRNRDFINITTHRRQLIDILTNAIPVADEVDLPGLHESTSNLKTKIRPYALVPFESVRDQWGKVINDAAMFCTMITSFGNEEQHTTYSTESDNSLSESSEGSSASSPNTRTAKRRQLAKEKKRRDTEEQRAARELEAQKQREEDELRAAQKKKEDEERAEQKRIEDELRAAKKKKEDEEWAAQQKRLEEKRVMQRKLEQEAKATKKKQEQERIQKLIEERNRVKRAEEEKKAKERAEREARERIERERVEQEKAEREEKARIEKERIEKEKAEREEKSRAQAKQLADAQNTILQAIAQDTTKLDPNFMLKFMQAYAPSLVRFARFEDDDEGLDPLMGSCQICFENFGITQQKKPLYLKCCAQSLCAGCMQKVLNKPHRDHRLEFDEDDSLVHQWAVMRRALGLQVPEY
jgi:hypothetical protein